MSPSKKIPQISFFFFSFEIIIVHKMNVFSEEIQRQIHQCVLSTCLMLWLRPQHYLHQKAPIRNAAFRKPHTNAPLSLTHARTHTICTLRVMLSPCSYVRPVCVCMLLIILSTHIHQTRIKCGWRRGFSTTCLKQCIHSPVTRSESQKSRYSPETLFDDYIFNFAFFFRSERTR